jgi:RHH-type transcriptional regulator, rel operon repressor / antitoxin RelB
MQAVRLPKELDERLAKLAKETGRTKSYYARRAIAEWLDEREDDLIALQRLEEVERGGRTYSLDEVKRELGLNSLCYRTGQGG